ncbi:MAG TPA: signal peptidase II [Dehalococcoidia bacterium]|nr:signal peptidase II [Dehalococcoidia bacterium]
MATGEVGVESRPGRSGPLVRRLRHDAPFFALAALVFILDFVTKSFVRSNLAVGESWPHSSWLVKITHVTNSGAAFGILQGQGVFLTITAVIAIGAIAFYYASPPMEHGLLRLALALELGGAAGNLLDRVRFGRVTDFIDFPHYPEFNVADSSIVIGLIVIAAFYVLSEHLASDGSPDDG